LAEKQQAHSSGGHGFKLMLLLDLVLVLDRVEPASRWKLKYAFA
jgi:hypothetical protein